MPFIVSGGTGGGVIYVETLPDPTVANVAATYGRISDDPVSLWRIEITAEGTVTTFADSSGRYKGAHNANPSAPTHADDYYFNANFEHFRTSRIQIGGTLFAWENPDSPINNYLPADHVWIDGDGSEGGQGAYATDDDAVAYLDTQAVQDHENYVFFNQTDDEVRSIAGAGFIHARRVWQAVSSGDGPVPGPPGRDGTGTADLERTGKSPQILSGAVDWDDVTDAGFYTITAASVQTNAPLGTVLGACHVFSAQTYLVQIGWSFEASARTFTRTRPGGSGTAFGTWERIHIPIDAIVSLLEGRTGDDRLLVSALRGIIPVSMLPDEVVLESEFTAARVRGMLGLTAAEVDDLFTGATIAGQIITYTQNDGTVETITIPVAAGGMADGVVQSAVLNGQTLVLTLSTGGTVDIDLSAVALDTDLTSAIAELRAGVAAEYDTLVEIAARLAELAPLANPALTGTPTAPTPTDSSPGTQIATKESVDANVFDLFEDVPDTTGFFDADDWMLVVDTTTAGNPNARMLISTLRTNIRSGLATLANPTFTGTPDAPTPPTNDNSTRIATTAMVTAAIAAALISGGADGVLASAEVVGTNLRLTLSDGTILDVPLVDLLAGVITGIAPTPNGGLIGGGSMGDVTLGIAPAGVLFAMLASSTVASILQSSALTGIPTAPTPTDSSPDDQVANKEYVDNSVGTEGPQGQYDRTIYQAANSPPAIPTFLINVATGIVTPPANWSNDPVTPTGDQVLYGSRITVDPATQSGIISEPGSVVFVVGSVSLAVRQEILPFTAIVPTNAIQGFAFNVSLGAVPQDSYFEIEFRTVNGIIFGDRRHLRDFRAGPPVVVGQTTAALGIYGLRGIRGEDVSSLGSNAALGVYYGRIDDNNIGVASSNAGDDPFDDVRVVITPLSGVQGEPGQNGTNTIRVRDESSAAVSGIEELRVVGAAGMIEVEGVVATLMLAGSVVVPPTHTSYVAVSEDAVITESEALAGTSGTGNALAVPDFIDPSFVAFLRPVSQGIFTAVYLYAEGARNTQNQITAWTQQAAPLDVGGEDHYILITNGPLDAPQGFTLVVEVV